MKELVEIIAKALVDHPEDVKVNEVVEMNNQLPLTKGCI